MYCLKIMHCREVQNKKISKNFFGKVILMGFFCNQIIPGKEKKEATTYFPTHQI